ncbi:TPA: DUF2026 family protein [Vibrio cholerae]|uniref:DUF2026 family protein n=1 Tax=Vibrio cholerae TaxID=666 RepID=UPI00301AE306|nr:DUF2026 family protein [Vibrio cholerae]
MKLDIKLRDYELIYKVVSGVGEKLAHGAGRSCQFYNVNGAFLLNKFFKVKARPVMGAAFFRLSENGDTLSFAEEKDGSLYSTPQAFHCWVETESNIIDFTAPEFRETLSMAGQSNSLGRYMFQKPKSLMSDSPYDMAKVGDFFLSENEELTAHLLKAMFKKPSAQDLAEVCLEWCKRSKYGFSELEIINDLGEKVLITPKKHNLVGVW